MLDLGTNPALLSKPETPVASTEQPSRTQDILAGLLVVMVGLASLMVFFLSRAETAHRERLDATYEQLLSEVTTGQAADLTKQIQQLAATIQLLERGDHASLWSLFFKEVQRTTTPGITLQTLTVDERSVMKIEGRADSYQTVARYLATLRSSPYASHVELISTSLSSDASGPSVSFGFGLTLKTDQFLPQAANALGAVQ